MVRIIAMLGLCVLAFMAEAVSPTEGLMPGTPYYYEDFNPAQQPWTPGQYLNIEEVFKNYQYFEIIVEDEGRAITVNRFVQGSRESSEKYTVLPDGSLRK